MNRTEHLLMVVMEECAETAQRASKAARFGLLQIQPGQDLDNLQRLIYEYSDLVGVMEMLGIYPDPRAVVTKQEKVQRYLALSASIGTLTEDGGTTQPLYMCETCIIHKCATCHNRNELCKHVTHGRDAGGV